jgi:putative hemolysin
MLVAEFLVIVAMIIVNAVFAAYEIALTSVSIARVQLLARENRPGAAAALRMKQRMESSLAALQVGITLAGAIAAATGGAGAVQAIAPLLQEPLGISEGLARVLAIALVVLPLTIATIVLGELVPKVYAIRNKEAVCLRLSPAMRWFASSVRPAVWLFETFVMSLMRWGERRWQGRDAAKKSEAAELLELRAYAAQARASRLIGEKEEGIIVGAARLSSRPISEILLPAEHISMLNVSDSLADSLVAAHLDMHTRFPVAERRGDPQSILGYVNFKDIVVSMRLSLPQQPSLRAILRTLPSLTAETPIATCMEVLIREHTHIALIRDAAGRIAGMITLEDIVEELVGDIQDEYDRLPAHVAPSGYAWVVGGGIGLARLKELTGIDLTADLPAAGARNLSDWVAGHLGGPIHGGEVIERGEVRVVVRKVRRQKVLEAQVGHAVAASTPTM